MQTSKFKADMVDDKSNKEDNIVVTIIYLPVTFLRNWNISVVTPKVPPVNTTKDDLTPYL